MDSRQQAWRTFRIWIALMALLALTLSSAYLRMGPWNSVVNLAIAFAKAALVATFFMHLRGSLILVRVIAGTALFTLALLFAVSSTDYATRGIYRAPVQSPAVIGR